MTPDAVAAPLVVDKDVVLAIINAAVSIATVVGSIFAAFFAFRANSSSRENRVQLADTKNKVDQLEANTNGIHRELIDQKGRASYMEGHERARIEGEAKTAEIVESVAQAVGLASAAATSTAPADPIPVATAIADVARKAAQPQESLTAAADRAAAHSTLSPEAADLEKRIFRDGEKP